MTFAVLTGSSYQQCTHCFWKVFPSSIKLLLIFFDKYHSFPVRNILISFLHLIIWHDLPSWCRPFLILLSGGVETNPGPKLTFGESFLNGQWNLSSILARNCAKIFLLTGWVLLHNFDIIYLFETYLNSTTLAVDQSYYILRTDHPSSDMRGGVCIFHRASLPLKVLNISYLSECISF